MEGPVAIKIVRRQFISVLAGAVVWPLATRAQQPPKLPIIGFMGSGTAAAQSQWTAAFLQRLQELGWKDGSTVAIEYRWAEGSSDRAIEIAAEFARLKVDVIVTYANPMVFAAKHATSVIPIIFAAAADPLGTGLVASLARPGGNVTGLSIQDIETAGKRLQLLREVVPGLRRVAILVNVDNPASMRELDQVQVSKRPHQKSDGRRTLRLPLWRSRAARKHFTSVLTPFCSPNELLSPRWRWPHDCRRCTVTVSTSQQAV
jgi:putative ABC transport system substrate-binding protein